MNSTTLMPRAASLVTEAVRVRSPYAGLAAVQACSAPTTAAHGTTVSSAGFSLIGVDAQDVPGSPPRGAPV